MRLFLWWNIYDAFLDQENLQTVQLNKLNSFVFKYVVYIDYAMNNKNDNSIFDKIIKQINLTIIIACFINQV